MTDVFALDQAGADEVLAQASANLAAPGDVHPGLWAGVPKAVGMAVPRALAEIPRAAELAGAIPVGFAEPFLGYKQGELTDKYFAAVDPTLKDAVDYWTPRAEEVGSAGQVLGGVVQGLTQLAAGGGNPALLLATTTLDGAERLADQGVSPDVAAAGGALEGAANAFGLKIPFLGKSLLTRMASGAAGNVVVGRAATLAQQKLLTQTGNEQAAAGYNPWDMTSVGLDALMGLAYGGIAHLQSPVQPLERDAALATLNAKHFQHDTAPGVPVDAASSLAHQKAIEQSIRQILAGDPVTPHEAIMGAGFIPTPPAQRLPTIRSTAAAERAQMDHIVSVLSGPAARNVSLAEDLVNLDANRAVTIAHERTSEIPRSTRVLLSPDERAIESRFAEQIATAPDAAEQAYAKLKDAQGGKVLNVDTARELSPDYLRNRTLSAAVHEPASWLIKRMYARMLKEAPAPGQEPLVLFTAGWTGAGKSTAIKSSLDNIADRAQIVYDTNMDSAPSAIAKIQQALDAGKQVKVAYVYRDPAEALRLGALTRAMRQEGEFGSGRTVPIDTHIDTHTGSNEAIREVAAHFANDSRVDITVIDNSRGKHNSTVINLEDLPKIDYNVTRDRSKQTIEAERAAARISESVYRGFAGTEAHPANGKPAEVGAGAGGQPESQRPGQRPDELKPAGETAPDPVVASARSAAIDSPNLQIATGEFDAQGQPMTASAGELLARSDAEVASAQEQGKAYAAAVNCVMQKGT